MNKWDGFTEKIGIGFLKKPLTTLLVLVIPMLVSCSGGDVTPPDSSSTSDSGAIRSISSTPTTITLRGTGGEGLTDTSHVIFKVVDQNASPISGKTVNFTLSTTLGGTTLFPTSAISNTLGEVAVDVHAGTIGTPVRVIASTVTNTGVTLTVASSQLVISTGLPDQDSFSLSNDTYNLEGWNYDGVSANLTVRMADHFNNPVPDGTAVYFTTEGGAITPSCNTLGGVCSVTLSSQSPRPIDGRVTILAYAIGEESFKDLDGDGLADLSPNETVADLPEAWRDDNYNGYRDADETPIDFNNNGIYDLADGKFNTNLCNESVDPLDPTRVSSAGSCSTQKTVHVRKNLQVVFSGSFVYNYYPTSVTLASCDSFRAETLYLLDENNNPLPKDTTIELSFPSPSPVKLSGTASFTIGSGTSPSQSTFLVTGDDTCASGAMGLLTIVVTTPLKNSSSMYIPINVL
ncbi:MAG: hypothetical protein HGA96_00620 [Desulfobulbaceae bacterium]|nr:hypothetical protein [Desulfobulbaceae bacterium]